MQNTENRLKIDEVLEELYHLMKIDEVLEELYHLREENQDLRLENDFLQRKAGLLKRDNIRITNERNTLMRRFHIKPMTDSDYAEERFLENGVKAYEASLRLGDDF